MAMPVAQLVEAFERDRSLGPQLVEALYLPPTEEVFGEPDPPLSESVARALAATGAERLWRHQVEGLNALGRGENVLVTTPTASGKSLVFHLPVLEEAVGGGPGRALFLYPLKALGRDQRGKLEALARPLALNGGPPLVAVYDGDTPQEERGAIKRRFPRVVITNPDMLHLGILGHWQSWAPFLRELRWIVLDELHTYRGIFGSHFHHVLQRLQRLARAEGADPLLVASSATAANAGEFAARLTGRDFHWIRDSGSPQQGRHFLLFRPVASPYTLALQLLVELLRQGLKTIVFTKARRITELLYAWLRQQEPSLADKVASYRSGFLPGERRKIERRLFEGRLSGVISTSALEMGIDVGGLDACVLVGFPGSVMATWQRSGRVGRAGRESLTALVALPDALDHYLLDHPLELVERPCERLLVDPANEPVSRAHLVCAASELPLHRDRDRDYLESQAPLVGELLRQQLLVEKGGEGELTTPHHRPHHEVSLRGAGETATILESGRGRLIGTVDGVRVLHECHPGAIYLHRGRQFLVRTLDLEARKVHAEPVDVDYYTSPLTEKSTEILEVLEHRREDGDGLEAFLGRLRVTERVTGYERRRVRGQEPIDQHELELPEVAFETVGLWWLASRPLEDRLRSEEFHFMGALHAAEHATISLLPLHTLCDRGDVGGISIPLHPQLSCGAVFIYDGHPGGVGISARAYHDLPALLERVADLLRQCDCEDGCPTCVQSPKCGNGNRPLDKDGAFRFLRLVLADAADAADAAVPEAAGRTGFSPEPSMSASVSSVVAPPPSPDGEPVIASATPQSVAAPIPNPPPLPAPRRPQRTMLFALEPRHSPDDVGGRSNAHRMRLAVGVVCHLQEGRFEVFREERVGDLCSLLDSADAVVGFDSRRFGYQVLAGYTGLDYERRWPTLDLLDDLHRRLGLRPDFHALADATLGVDREEGDGDRFEWVRAGDLEKVESCCRRDVELLRDLYLFGRRMQYVVCPRVEGAPVRVLIDW